MMIREKLQHEDWCTSLKFWRDETVCNCGCQQAIDELDRLEAILKQTIANWREVKEICTRMAEEAEAKLKVLEQVTGIVRPESVADYDKE